MAPQPSNEVMKRLGRTGSRPLYSSSPIIPLWLYSIAVIATKSAVFTGLDKHLIDQLANRRPELQSSAHPPIMAAQAYVYPPKVPDWQNLEVIHRNTLTPRPHFFVYDDESSALTRDSSRARVQCLSGTWKFHFSKTPLEGPADFFRHGYNATAFAEVQVPGMWQLQGFGKPHYSNVEYPWPVDPPNVPQEDNQCGRYITKFHVSKAFADNAQLRLRFEGVDSAFTLWVNGKEVGYAQGSRNPSEWDITEYINVDADNTLAV